MAKSLGNVIPANHFCEKYGANVLRYLVLNTHYNQVINFNEELISQGVSYIQKIKSLLKRLFFYLYDKKINIKKKETEKTEKVVKTLLSNLNTIKVIYYLEEAVG